MNSDLYCSILGSRKSSSSSFYFPFAKNIIQLLRPCPLKCIYISMSLLLLFCLPQYAFSQGTGSQGSSGTMPGVNMTTVIKDRELPLHPDQFWLALFISGLIILGITLIVAGLIIQRSKKQAEGLRGIKFFDFIRDGDYYPSLPRFQFLIWTWIISFVYLSIYLIRVASGEFDAPIIDNNLLALLGISIASPILGNVISGYKYTSHVSENISPTVHDHEDDDRKSLTTMLFENNKPALFRYQMFLWTFVGVTIFIGLFVAGIYDYVQRYQQCIPLQTCTEIVALAMPKIDNMLVALMGLSQSGYLGGKIVARTPARITRVVQGLSNKLVIFGLNFGEKSQISSGTILIDNIVVAGHTDDAVKWFDTKIEFPIADEYKNKSFKIGIVIDDLIFLEYDYRPKNK